MEKLSAGPPPADWIEALLERANPHCRWCYRRHCKPTHAQLHELVKTWGNDLLWAEGAPISVKAEKDGTISMREVVDRTFFYTGKGPTYVMYP